MQIRKGRRAYSVGELTRYIKTILQGQRVLQNIAVNGEVSNLRRQQSGHIYFTLKDESASLACVMFRTEAARLSFHLENGMKVWAIGSIGVYEVSGAYQLYVSQVEPVGQGSLQLALEQLKQRLASEGLFDPSRRRPIPMIPKGIGLVTSPSGAAMKDFVSVVQRRFPNIPIVLAPALVQGKDAPQSIVQALAGLNICDEIDVVVLARGGGALEDLWCFNDEAVARAIAACRFPVVSAVGHETDVTIADLVADLRAPTPSAAGELVVPDRAQLQLQVQRVSLDLQVALQRWLEKNQRRVQELEQRLQVSNPLGMIQVQLQRVDELMQRAVRAIQLVTQTERERFASVLVQLEQLSPLATLRRGYTVCRFTDGPSSHQVVRSVQNVSPGQGIEVLFVDGAAQCLVQSRSIRVEGAGENEV